MYKLKSPLSVGFQIIGSCNLKCAYCYAHKAAPIIMQTRDALKIVDDLIELEIVSVSIEGGEPLLHPDFEKITLKFLDAGIDVALLTNGTIKNKNVTRSIKALSDKYDFFTFQISLDSYNVEVNEITRGRSEAVLKNILEFSKDGIEITIATVVHAFNINHIFEMMDKLRTYVKNFHFMNLMPISGGQYKINGLIPKPKLLKEFWLKLLEYRHNNPELFISTPFNDFNENFGIGVLNCNGCTAAVTRATITPDMLLIPCGICSDLVLGDLKKQKIENFWNSEKVNLLRNIKYPLCKLSETKKESIVNIS